jgi:hypothetical protein
VYANNSPPPDARVFGDLLQDISLRFSVPTSSITCMLHEDHLPLTDLEMPIASAPRRMLVRINQANGASTTYDTELEFASA